MIDGAKIDNSIKYLDFELSKIGIGPTVGGLTAVDRDLLAAGVNSRHFIEGVAAILKPGKFAMVGGCEWEVRHYN